MSNRKYDKNNNVIYNKNSDGKEFWWEYDENNNLIYRKEDYESSAVGGGHTVSEYRYKYDENNNLIYEKLRNGMEFWYKYDKNNKKIIITEKEYNEIEFRKKEKEYNSRTKCSRFELMEI